MVLGARFSNVSTKYYEIISLNLYGRCCLALRLAHLDWGALGWVNRDSVDAATLAFVRLGVGAASADLLVACNASTVGIVREFNGLLGN